MNVLDDYSILKKDEEGLWSLTHKKYADQISQIIFDMIGYNITICDATAGLGGNTISFCKYFEKVVALEKNKNRFKLLDENVKLFKLKNLELINDTCIDYLNNNYDVFFFDPPWGGLDYKKNKNILLQLDNYTLKSIVDIIKKNNKLCVLKLPSNYDISEFNDYKLVRIHNYIILII